MRSYYWLPYVQLLHEKWHTHASPCPYKKGYEREFKLMWTIARSWCGREVVQKHWWDTEYG